MSSTIMKHFLWELFICILLLIQGVASISYGTALKKSLLYFEAQRSGKLPSNQRVKWRGDSAVNDSDVNIDLSGGYYDSGDNVKYGFPMAFTTTLLAMSVVDFRKELKAKKELANALHAVKWATDYMIKAHPEPNVFYGEVGDGKTDHDCWQRPEDMTIPRTSYKIDADHPGSDLAAETAAALAAASIAFNDTDPNYSVQLLTHAEQLFEFASNHPGLYHKSIKVASKFYPSSRDEDELGWAAGWLFRATGDTFYIRYINGLAGQGGTRTTFSWDDKYTGSQLLIARYVMFYGYDKVGDKTKWRNYKRNAEEFLCQWLGLGLNNLKKTPGGLVWWEQQWNPLQYTTSASLLAVSYAKYLDHANQIALCENGHLTPDKLISFARTQVNYILGSNPKKFSYMVGYGTHYPKRVHHRGASIVSIKEDPTPVTCKGGFENWFNRNESNPNVLEGAIVGGPDENDEYQDSRVNYEQAEPATVNTAPLVGVLAKLASIYG